MKAIVNIKQVPVEKTPARQQKAWNEFLEMIEERALKILQEEQGEKGNHYAKRNISS